MKSFIFSLFLGLLTSAQALALRCYFDYRNFFDPEGIPYTEAVVSFDGATVQMISADSGLFQSSVEVTFIFSQQNEVKFFKKVTVSGPLVEASKPADFMGFERFSLPSGAYDLELVVVDLGDPAKVPSELRQPVVVPQRLEGPGFGDIQYVTAYRKTETPNAFSKSGVDLVPYVSDYFPSQLQVLIFYTELYQTDRAFGAGNPMVVSSFLEDIKGVEVPETRRMKREKATAVFPMLQTLDISLLPTGAYTLVVELRNRDNQVVTFVRRTFSRVNMAAQNQLAEASVSDQAVQQSFARFYTNRDTLFQLLQAHSPIADKLELNTIQNSLPSASLNTLQSFFYTFWYNRSKSDPYAAWQAYEKQVQEVQAAFGTRIKRGWETDRGRVYLQYGPPNTRVQRPHQPGYWPFEIWHYYETNNNLRNARFLFIDTSLGGDYELLHSDAPNEVRNFDWKNMARNRTMASPSDMNRLGNNQPIDPYSRDMLEDLWYNPY
jgi:GWxTD domain-containing protein